MCRHLWTALLASLLLLATACGTTGADEEADGKEADGATTTTENPSDDATSTTEEPSDDSTSTTGDDGEGDGDGQGSNPEFCEATAELNSMFEDLAQEDYQGFVDAIEEGEDEYETILATIPDDLKDEAEIVIELVRAMAVEMDKVKDDPDAAEKVAAKVEELQTDEVQAAEEALSAYEEATCATA
jgi:hypothetical protein